MGCWWVFLRTGPVGRELLRTAATEGLEAFRGGLEQQRAQEEVQLASQMEVRHAAVTGGGGGAAGCSMQSGRGADRLYIGSLLIWSSTGWNLAVHAACTGAYAGEASDKCRSRLCQRPVAAARQ